MSDEHPFELQPPGPEPEAPGPAPSPASQRRRRRRTRAAPQGEPPAWLTWAKRAASPLVSPTFYYILGFLTTLGLLLCLFNPKFGNVLPLWPHEVLGAGSIVFEWGPNAVRVVCLTVLIAAYVIALLMRPGSLRATIVLGASFIAYVTFESAPSYLNFYVLPAMVALVVGALIADRGGEGRRRPHGFLWIALLILTAHLFMPWDSARVNSRRLPPGYYSTAVSTVDLYLHPPEEFFADEDPYAADVTLMGYPRIVMSHLAPTIACLLVVVGVLTLIGLGGHWARWVAGALFLLMWLGTLLALYLTGRDSLLLANLPEWQRGLNWWAETWHQNFLAYAVPLAGAVAELVRGRSA